MATTEPDAGQASFEEEKSAHDFIDLKSMKDVKALEKEEIYAYIDKLHGIIRKYDTNIASYKQKLKHFLNKELQSAKSEKCTQVSNDDFQESNSEKENEQEEGVAKEISATDAFSFVDEMRQAAKHAENLNNFVYEPTSGMYYDPKTGYYYNAEYGLYYDGNTGCYYSYDQAKDSFEFHSQAQVQANGSEQQQAENDEQDDDVEFDEHGGVITDKATLQQIKEEKQKQKERAERSKRKAKKKKKKLKKKEKNRHKSKKRHNDRRNKSDVEADENSDNESSRKRARKLNDVEDGELSHSSSSSSSGTSDVDEDGSNSDTSVPVFKVSSRFQDIAKQYPPCLRIIVQETNVPELTVGSLHLVTYLGGSLGREGDSDVIIPDVNVSKCHLDFEYDKRKGVYKCRDLGSRNGTILNGIRMSDSLATSNWQDVVHGSVIGIAQTKLLCHVHEGNSTCGLCEPGLLIETPTPSVAASSANTNVLSHREQLKRLQKKYGLENEKFVETSGNANPNYNDRSAQRRIKVGSSTDKEKTEVACVNTEIASSNKGFKMLSKLGWQKGDTLGKTNQGLLTPINVVANEGKTGLGSNEPPASSSTRPVDKRKYANLKITQARYERAKDIFKETEESD